MIKKRSKAAFTLVELMVTLSVVALLAAMLLPVLSQAKASARRAQCIGNLRQLSLATAMYTDENDHRFFRYRGPRTETGDLFWFGWLARGTEGERAFDPVRGVLHPYLLGRGVETCPALNYAAPYFKPKAKGAAYGYGYNLHLSTPPEQPRLPVSDVTAPSGVALFADAAQVNTFQPPASPDRPMLEEFYYVSTNLFEATAHFRHRRTANVLFCDGHVASEPPAQGSIDRRLPNEFVGRLRYEILQVR